MKIWVDDIRTPPDEDWIWCKTSEHAISILENVSKWHTNEIEVMSLDHDLGIMPYSGGKEDTTRPIVLWCCENDFWPFEVRVHSANSVGREWLEGMIERYKT